MAPPARPRIVALGDSITVGLGLLETQAFPALLQAKIDEDGYQFEVVNAGVSGDTSAGGLRRLDWALEGDVKILILALGANDGLRGLSVADMKQNLTTIIERARGKNIVVILAGMEAPPNYGPEYVAVVPRGVPRGGREAACSVHSVHPRQGGGRQHAESSRRYPPECRRRPGHCRHGVAGAEVRDRSDGGGPVIELRGVSRTVPSGAGALTILHPIDLTVPRGRVLTIVGASGSGKSTLLGLIAGLDAPSTGSIVIEGVDITTLSEDALARLRGARIGFVFQSFHLLPSLTAFENVLVPIEIAGGADPARRAKALLAEVGLSERGHHYPSQLSGGEQQRVAIARALANSPPILLADEPTGNLDSTTGRQVIDLLLDIHRSRKTTLILVTHDPEIAAIADMSVTLRDGRIVRTVEAVERQLSTGTAD